MVFALISKVFCRVIKKKSTLNVFSLLVIRYGSTALAFFIGLIIARSYGSLATGTYYLFVSMVNFFALLSKFGSERMLTRVGGAESITPKLKSIWLKSMVVASVLSFFVSMALFAVGPYLFHWFYSFEDSQLLVFLTIVTLFPLSFLGLNCGLLRGLKMPKLAALFDGLLLQGLIFILIIFLALRVIEDAQVCSLYAYSASVIIVSLFSIFAVAYSLRNVEFSFKSVSYANIFVDSWPLFGVSVIVFLTNWTSSFFLAAIASESEVGIYNICWRIVLFLGMVMMVFNNINSPYFSKLYSDGNIDRLEDRARRTSKLCLIIGVLVYAPLFIYGEFILGIFGPDFISGLDAMLILSAGQLFSMSFGSVGYILMMTGHGKVQRNLNLCSLVLLFLSAPILIAQYGIVGAAISTSLVISFNNVAASIAVRRFVGIQVFPLINARFS